MASHRAERLLTRTVVLVAAVGVVAAAALEQAPADATLPPRVEAVYRALDARVREQNAMDLVVFMDQFWRVAGNPGFDATVERLRADLSRAGFRDRAQAGADQPRVWIDEFPNTGRGWDHRVGTLSLVSADDATEVLLSRERDRVALCINSFSTPPGGLVAPVVDVGAGAADADYAGKDVRGAVVLGDASAGRLFQQAVRQRGAAGVISTAVESYVRPSSPDAFTSADQWDVFQWSGIPYDDTRKAFGFKAPYRVAARLRDALRRGPARVRVEIDAAFYQGPVRTLVAEIPGRSRPQERIVMVAHIQEPGANDDASGCGTLYEMARALAEGIAAGAIAPPERTLTFLWGDEIRASRQWLRDHPEEAKGVQDMFSLDMTGEDVTKTGGTFLVEKQPDPSAVWDRPSDPHTAWGRGEVKPESLKGSLLNDLHLAVCARRARDTGWAVKTNPYEGGSDHSVFLQAGVPSLLDWHFTDRYYHTNLDRPDKTSAAEMKNVGIAVAVSAWWLASSNEAEALAVADLVEGAATARLELERRQGRQLIEQAADRASAEALERTVLDAWTRWYVEALQSVLRLPAAPASETLRERVAGAIAKLRRDAARESEGAD
jgi:hypothetical protein